jgi:hypothetical protein
MDSPGRKIKFLIFAILLFSVNAGLCAQGPLKTIIKGTVRDALTGEPLPFVSVYLKGTTIGTLTDQKGKFLIETNVMAKTLVYSFVGYNTESRNINPGREQTIDVAMSLASITLEEVIVKPPKKSYKNKGNPAVELIKNVIVHKETNRPEAYNFLEYKRYEKIQFAISNISEKFKSNGSTGKFGFVYENIDTTRRIGNNILPVFLKESLSDHYYRREPEAAKEITLAEKAINLDEYIDKKGVTAYLNYLYQNVNIYDEEILFLTNKFSYSLQINF